MIKSTHLSILFWIILLLNLIGIMISNMVLANTMKVFLMPALAIMFLISTRDTKQSKLKRWTLLAITFSWMGDILLIFQEVKSNFFLFGLGAFLISHINYIISYRIASTRPSPKLSLRDWLIPIIILSVYLILLFKLIGPGLDNYTIPVIFYAIAISTMFLVSFSRKHSTSSASFQSVLTGACLFVISDSLIALNKFWEPFFQSGLWIMLTYGSAQFLIIKGLIKHMQDQKQGKLP